jgi:hypothetical protein
LEKAIQQAELLIEGAATATQQQIDDCADALVGAIKGLTTTNLALYKPAQASNPLNAPPSFSLDGITDGSYTKMYSSGELIPNVNHEEWVSIDLGAMYEINRVNIGPRSDGDYIGLFYPIDYKIQVSDDGQDWKDVAAYEGVAQPTTIDPIAHDFDTVEARYVRLFATNLREHGITDSNYRLQVSEIEVYGPEAPESVDTTRLLALVGKMSAFYNDKIATKDKFTTDSWQRFEMALNAARMLLETPDVSQTEIDGAYEALNTAYANLKDNGSPGDDLKEIKSALTTKIAEAVAIVQGNKSAVAYAALQSAIASAQAVLNRPDAMRTEIEAALTMLKAAIEIFNGSADVIKPEPPSAVDVPVVTNLSTAKISAEDKVWTGKKIMSGFALTAGGKKLVVGTDYTVTATGANKNIGKGTVQITGKGGYTGSATVSFKIVPKAVKINSAKAGKKSLTVKWASAPKAAKITKYQVRYKVKGTKSWTSKNVSANQPTLKIGKLKKGKRYNVQIRAYKTVGDVNYYGAWSGSKTSAKLK